jgi:YihY family inner membrane protein
VIVQVLTHASTRVVTEIGGAGDASAALGSLAELGGSVGLTFAAFLALYRIVPPVPVRLRDVLPAAALAAIGVQVAGAGFSVYLEHFADFDEVYGSLGAVFAFLLLVYVAAWVLLFGACVAAAWPASAHEPAVAHQASLPVRRRLRDAALGLVVRRRREDGPDDASRG